MGSIFSYHAKDKNGKYKDGAIEAINQDDAINKLEAQELCVVSIRMVEIEKKPEIIGNQPIEKSKLVLLGQNPYIQALACIAIIIFLIRPGGYFSKTTFMKSLMQPFATSKSSHTTRQEQSYKQAQEDTMLSELIYEAGKEGGVTRVEVSEGVMMVNVNMELYRAMYGDKITGNQIMRSWQKLLAKQYDKRNGIVGIVMLYLNGQKVAECDASWTGEVSVKWSDN